MEPLARRADLGGEAALTYGCPRLAGGGSITDEPELLALGHGETVLIVESERENLLPDEEKLAALGYEPVGFEHAGDALAACRAEPY